MKNKYDDNLTQVIGCSVFLLILIYINNEFDMIYRYSDIIESRLQYKIAKANVKSVELASVSDGYITSISYSFLAGKDSLRINRDDQKYLIIFTSDYVSDDSIVIYYENDIKSSRLLLIEDFIVFFIFSLFMPIMLLYEILVIVIRLGGVRKDR